MPPQPHRDADHRGRAGRQGWTGRPATGAKLTAALAEVETLSKMQLTATVVVGVDETTLDIAGTTQRLHAARTDLLTAYRLHQSGPERGTGVRGGSPATRERIVRGAIAVPTA